MQNLPPMNNEAHCSFYNRAIIKHHRCFSREIDKKKTNSDIHTQWNTTQ